MFEFDVRILCFCPFQDFRGFRSMMLHVQLRCLVKQDDGRFSGTKFLGLYKSRKLRSIMCFT